MIGKDALLVKFLLGENLGLLDVALGRDFGFPGGTGLVRPLFGDFRRLSGARDFDLSLLLEAGVLLLFLDGVRQLLGFEVALFDLDARLLLDVVALLAARFDLLGEASQTLRVERVLRVEILLRSLVERGQRDAFQFETVLEEVFGNRCLHALDELGALFVKLFHTHLGGDRAERVDELTFDQLLQRFGLHRALAERLRGVGDGVFCRLGANVELGRYVDAHAIAGDERLLIRTAHFEAQRVHVDPRDLVDDREDHLATVDDDFLTAESRPHERTFLRCLAIERGEHDADDQHRDDETDADESG